MKEKGRGGDGGDADDVGGDEGVEYKLRKMVRVFVR